MREEVYRASGWRYNPGDRAVSRHETYIRQGLEKMRQIRYVQQQPVVDVLYVHEEMAEGCDHCYQQYTDI